MPESTQQWIYLLVSYLIAAIPFGLVIAKVVTGRDVRRQGSGNIGATNVARVMGKKWGVLVLFLDALKGFAVVTGALHLGDWAFANTVAVIAVLGHCFPVYLKFKGGKGVATSLGVIAALSWTLVGILLAVFVVMVAITRRISVGSLAAALALPLAAIFYPKMMRVPTASVIALIVWWKHQANIKRIFRGQEPKFF